MTNWKMTDDGQVISEWSGLHPQLEKYIFPEPNTGCWLWTGALNQDGYGFVHFQKHYVSSHRLVYKYLRGVIPVGLSLDHLCRMRCCCNPDHLEPVTPKVNSRRGNTGLHWSLKTCCPKGHPYNLENTYFYVNKKGQTSRHCVICRDARRAQAKNA